MTKHIHIHVHRQRAKDAGFNEGDHPRDGDGKFSSGGGGGGGGKSGEPVFNPKDDSTPHRGREHHNAMVRKHEAAIAGTKNKFIQGAHREAIDMHNQARTLSGSEEANAMSAQLGIHPTSATPTTSKRDFSRKEPPAHTSQEALDRRNTPAYKALAAKVSASRAAAASLTPAQQQSVKFDKGPDWKTKGEAAASQRNTPDQSKAAAEKEYNKVNLKNADEVRQAMWAAQKRAKLTPNRIDEHLYHMLKDQHDRLMSAGEIHKD